MALLTGKKLLITGISSTRSIAYGIAKACHEEGAELILTYNNERFRERLERFANDFGAVGVIQLNVASDESIQACADQVKAIWSEGFDGFVHSIAWAPREAIEGSFLEGLSREGFLSAINISAYSFAALGKAFLPQLEGHNASLVCMSFLGAEKVVPNYNTMGVAKAALEAVTRYMAADLGAKGIRVNALSSGPIRTLAASGIKDFQKMLAHARDVSPLRQTITIDDIGRSTAFLLSDYARGITAETIYVDAGFHAMAGQVQTDEQKE
ncbi:enoyl-ACP reductase FabI [Parasutterella secunda]|uniref:Enoyl-[acyl-carrier-protein] reductase [NADH] n=1 Tax=Parasutterella secunda TaxID=626947 RepID=A0ABS2GV38_9BURK|nr:enoyl-ACP reductase [Parasutterella secunda]MBM6928743.1 enoyl-ACP reductase [Parasutterella secunda]